MEAEHSTRVPEQLPTAVVQQGKRRAKAAGSATRGAVNNNNTATKEGAQRRRDLIASNITNATKSKAAVMQDMMTAMEEDDDHPPLLALPTPPPSPQQTPIVQLPEDETEVYTMEMQNLHKTQTAALKAKMTDGMSADELKTLVKAQQSNERDVQDTHHKSQMAAQAGNNEARSELVAVQLAEKNDLLAQQADKWASFGEALDFRARLWKKQATGLGVLETKQAAQTAAVNISADGGNEFLADVEARQKAETARLKGTVDKEWASFMQEWDAPERPEEANDVGEGGADADKGARNPLEADRCESPFQVTQALVISAANGCPLHEDDWYIVVPWMKSIRSAFRITLVNMVARRTPHAADTDDKLDILAKEHNAASHKKLRDFLKTAVTAHKTASSKGVYSVTSRIINDAIDDNDAKYQKVGHMAPSVMIDYFDMLAIEACYLTNPLGSTISFITDMVKNCLECTLQQVDTNSDSDVSPYSELLEREAMAWALDEDMLVVAKHAHRSTTAQIRALGALAAELEEPAGINGSRGATSVIKENANVSTKIHRMMAVSAKVGSVGTSLPQGLCIRLCDLCPNRSVKEYLACIENVFGVNISFDSSGKSRSKLLDVGKFNGLLAWTASYCVSPGYEEDGQWMSASYAREGNDARYFLPNLKEAFTAHTGQRDADDFTPRRRVMGSGMSIDEFDDTVYEIMKSMMESGDSQGQTTAKQSNALKNLKRMRGMHMIGLFHCCWGTTTRSFGNEYNVWREAQDLDDVSTSPFATYEKNNVHGAAISFRDACDRVGFAKELLKTAMERVTNSPRVDKKTKNFLLQPDLCRWVVSKILATFASAARLKASGAYMAIHSIIATPNSTDFHSGLLSDTQAMVAMYDDGNLDMKGIDTTPQFSIRASVVGTGRRQDATRRRITQYCMRGLEHNYQELSGLDDDEKISKLTDASTSPLGFCLMRCNSYLNRGEYLDDPAGWLSVHHSQRHKGTPQRPFTFQDPHQMSLAAWVLGAACMDAKAKDRDWSVARHVVDEYLDASNSDGRLGKTGDNLGLLDMTLAAAALLLSPAQHLSLLKNTTFRKMQAINAPVPSAIKDGATLGDNIAKYQLQPMFHGFEVNYLAYTKVVNSWSITGLINDNEDPMKAIATLRLEMLSEDANANSALSTASSAFMWQTEQLAKCVKDVTWNVEGKHDHGANSRYFPLLKALNDVTRAGSACLSSTKNLLLAVQKTQPVVNDCEFYAHEVKHMMDEVQNQIGTVRDAARTTLEQRPGQPSTPQ